MTIEISRRIGESTYGSPILFAVRSQMSVLKKVTRSRYYQMDGQVLVHGVEYGDFFVWTRGEKACDKVNVTLAWESALIARQCIF